MAVMAYNGNVPDIDPSAWVAESASVVGDVRIAAEASIWYGAVVRGDSAPIEIGASTAVEDNVTIHGKVRLGERVIVGHNAVVHGCTVGDGALIGMGATVLDGAQIGEGALVAAGSLVPQNMQLAAGHLAMGVPAKDKGPLTSAQRESFAQSPERYMAFAAGQLEQWGEAHG